MANEKNTNKGTVEKHVHNNECPRLCGVTVKDLAFIANSLHKEERKPQTDFEQSLLRHVRGEMFLVIGDEKDIMAVDENSGFAALVSSKYNRHKDMLGRFQVDMDWPIKCQKIEMQTQEFVTSYRKQAKLTHMRNLYMQLTDASHDAQAAQYSSDVYNDFRSNIESFLRDLSEEKQSTLIDKVIVIPVGLIDDSITAMKITFADFGFVKLSTNGSHLTRKFWKTNGHWKPFYKSLGWTEDIPRGKDAEES